MKAENPSPSPREKEIFFEALQMNSPEDCASYLDRACGDDLRLRGSVEALIRNHRGEDFLEKIAPKVRLSESEMPHEKPGDVVGRYKLLKLIGEGGYGLVFQAEQYQPFRREVALKLIRPGRDTGQVLRRFEAERQALAQLQHSSIAKIFDAGTTSTGRPYFVMELVHGDKITDFADAHRLTIPQRLELFARVCRAVQHAHENGIIHRDIKPSNVLVAEEGDEPLPKVIDFGIAKVTFGEASDNAALTAERQCIGTPAYMSPEQANGRKVDRRADIYSLGVLLCELLTGYLPLNFDGLGYTEQLRTICETEPILPSARISGLSEKELLSVAKRRNAEPSVLLRSIRDGLDLIVKKCLAKSPEQRYETANSLANDIQRCLKSAVRAEPSPSKRRWWLGGLVLVGLTLTAEVVLLSSHHTDQATASTPNQENLPKPPSNRPQPSKTEESKAKSEETTPEKREFLLNKKIFLKARDAANAETFEGAQIILDQIDTSQISDRDLASFVAISKKIADFCPKVGITRDTAPTWSGVIKKIDLAALASQMIHSPLETLKTGREIKNEMPIYEELDQTLTERYGKG